MATADQHGLSGGSKTRSGYFGDLGGPSGGRDRREGSFLMRCAGLVACANRKNRAADVGSWHRQGQRNGQTSTGASTSTGRASVTYTERRQVDGNRAT